MERDEQKQFFNIHLARDMMGKSINQVLEQCATFNPQLFTPNSPLEDDYKNLQHLSKFLDILDAKVVLDCHFELQDYQASSSVGINFINNTAVECIISLGRPVNSERYGSELEVTKVFLISLEELYLNGKIQEEDELGTRVYTWKEGDNVVSFVSYPPSHRLQDTGALLGVQIRHIQLHPHGGYLEILYNQAQKSVHDFGYVMLHRKDEPLEKVYKGRGARYYVTSLLFLSAIGLGIGGIISLVLKSFTLGTILIICAVISAFLMSKLDYKARRDYRKKQEVRQR